MTDALREAWTTAAAAVRPSDRAAFTAEAAPILAAILTSGPGSYAAEWAAITGRPAGQFGSDAAAGRQYEKTVTPTLGALVRTDPEAAVAYARLFADVASAAASVEPIDLKRVNTASFIASAQLRAVAAVVPVEQILATQEVAAAVGPAQQTEVAKAEAAEEDEATLEELLAELDELIGLSVVKSEVRQQAELLRVTKLRADRGMKNPDVSRHLIFTGNPGTGKTTVARLVARIYRALGLLKKGHLIEIDRSGLVGGYLGQTEEKTAKVIQEALGGVLFIDEAYALAGDQYGDAAINTLVKGIEDHRDELVLIVAGYTGPMQEFIASNPGLESRLRLTIFFPDYSDDELEEIFTSLANKNDYEATADALAALRERLAAELRDESFGNARFVRNCFEAALVRHAWRIRDLENPTDEELQTLTADDVSS